MLPIANGKASFTMMVLPAIICTTTDAFGVKQSQLPLSMGKMTTSTRTSQLLQSNNDDPVDKRKGMADAFAALDSLISIDLEDNAETDDEVAELFAELMGTPKEVSTEVAVADSQKLNAEASVLTDVDGIGSISDNEQILTTADVDNDISSQDFEEILSQASEEALDVDSFMSSAFESALADLETEDFGQTGIAAEITKSVMQDEDFKKEVEAIFNKAADEMKNEMEVFRKEQEAVTEEARKRGLSIEHSQKRRLAEAEESVSRLIKKVAQETASVQQAMDDLERAKNEVSNSQLEEKALELKKGGIVKQAALVGMALFGSRAFTEAILVVGSPYGNEHFMSAAIQAVVALVCAAYFFLVK